MTDPTRSGAPQHSASALVRDAIDSGRTHDKVPAFDPAAAPLGTDAESAGATPIEQVPAAQLPRSGGEAAALPDEGDKATYRTQDRLIWPVIIQLTVLVAIAILAFTWLSR